MAPKHPKAHRLTNNSPNLPKALSRLTDADGIHTRPVFSFSLVDHQYSGEWGWSKLTDSDSKSLLELLREMARLTWTEVRSQVADGHKRHHLQSVGMICKAAQDRLVELKIDDINNEIFRFRLSGRKRLWGFVDRGIFHIVWWDPDHKIYPTEPN